MIEEILQVVRTLASTADVKPAGRFSIQLARMVCNLLEMILRRGGVSQLMPEIMEIYVDFGALMHVIKADPFTRAMFRNLERAMGDSGLALGTPQETDSRQDLMRRLDALRPPIGEVQRRDVRREPNP